MNARLEHVALWVRDLDGVAAFYTRYFDARLGALYENPRKGFQSRFLEFGRARAWRSWRVVTSSRARRASHWDSRTWPSSVGDEAAVDALAARFRAEGVALVDGPRRTGDGYYECVVLDPEGNRVEVTAD